MSIGGTYVYKHTSDIFANIPINRETGQQWDYERIPYDTLAGQHVMLYSVVQKDYNGDGVVDGRRHRVDHDNTTYQVRTCRPSTA
jgi:hypothetical protein